MPHLALQRWNTNVMSKTDLILLGNIGTHVFLETSFLSVELI
jgi:hypothetical protein